MASNISLRNLVLIVLAFSLAVQGTLGEIECDHLGQDLCAFAVSANGKRCVLEKHVKRTGEEAYTCRTSEIEADKINNHIETDQCIKACGLDRKSLGISSDSLLDSRFRQKLCSPNCYQGCPNVVDLFFNLAAGEGVFLPKLCEALSKHKRREMAELRSSGFVALGPVNSVQFTATAPEPFVAVVPPSPPVAEPTPVNSVQFLGTPPDPFVSVAEPVAEPVVAPTPY